MGQESVANRYLISDRVFGPTSLPACSVLVRNSFESAGQQSVANRYGIFGWGFWANYGAACSIRPNSIVDAFGGFDRAAHAPTTIPGLSRWSDVWTLERHLSIEPPRAVAVTHDSRCGGGGYAHHHLTTTRGPISSHFFWGKGGTAHRTEIRRARCLFSTFNLKGQS